MLVPLIAIQHVERNGSHLAKTRSFTLWWDGATLQKQLVFSNRNQRNSMIHWPALSREWGNEAIYGYDVDSFLHSLPRASQTKCAVMLTSCETLHSDWLSMSLSQQSGWDRWTFLRNRETHFLPGHLAIVSKLKIVEGPVVTSKINQKNPSRWGFLTDVSWLCFFCWDFKSELRIQNSTRLSLASSRNQVARGISSQLVMGQTWNMAMVLVSGPTVVPRTRELTVSPKLQACIKMTFLFKILFPRWDSLVFLKG